jgi:hypothetical protein
MLSKRDFNTRVQSLSIDSEAFDFGSVATAKILKKPISLFQTHSSVLAGNVRES